jgi:hypothetical protein
MPCAQEQLESSSQRKSEINCWISFGYQKMSVIGPLILQKSCPRLHLILAPWMQQRQAWVGYGSRLDQLSHSQFILTKRIVSKILASGELLFQNTSRMPSSHHQILTVTLQIATWNFVVLWLMMTSLHQKYQCLTLLRAIFQTTLLLSLGAQKVALQPPAQLHIYCNFPHFISATTVTNLNCITFQEKSIQWRMIAVDYGI